MKQNNHETARIENIKRWSPVWIVPIVTILIGAWILFYHFSHQGPEVTLITSNAEGIVPGKTTIKSRSVDIGLVQSAELSDDLRHVEIKARLNAGMEKTLHQDSVFWTVKPQIGREGITGLGTLLSGSYIELQPGTTGDKPDHYALLDSPPLAPPDAKGIRVTLDSSKAGQLNPGDPVLFRGYRVGSVETSKFDTEKRLMSYQLFIQAPYDRLVTTNVRFWKDSGVSFDMSASGMRIEMGSLTTLFSGGVSFEVPDGAPLGEPAKNNADYHLFDDQHSLQESIYTQHTNFVMFFNESIRGLQPGAPVEFRGIRLGTVAKVPYIMPGSLNTLKNDYRIPVLIRIEPGRLAASVGDKFDLQQHLQDARQHGLRGSLKTANLITGALYVDLDFYNNVPPFTGPDKVGDVEVIPTIASGLNQMQQKVMTILDKVEKLPLAPMLTEATGTLKQSQKTLKNMQTALDNLNKITSSPAMKTLPADMQQTLRDLNRSLKGLQPGSPAYNKLVGDMQRLDQVLQELQPVLKTLNNKSNALVFEAQPGKDPQPKRAK
ncbi:MULTISPECIES: intermembrane transport protein PqiB [Tatumella]|uniref:Intermembrane transport protein PqiB n=1 Tax=Tatumella punctata TaxID=399969 RepID=A0ABW1VUW5_9GAMM|nr:MULTISPECIES: intermembrane transport protein PqiB [unclassified Tatumella]MBS0854752.1 intermembrane transport protein PqiB [Tatumella sp. JGM16]MBS0878140.1 intermembrane transport protein PqiB [Tatumella sp. JGM82]MBS0889886.1 intermembrane transport protein PqiB [Tatumella sp. JGM94]MBS0892467.1 intermembrane transport protein PqiB [Tatumella sp. JGM130]MBS0902853.1 intermembrane transport protein PqiB [Tatumella sp. JGM100]